MSDHLQHAVRSFTTRCQIIMSDHQEHAFKSSTARCQIIQMNFYKWTGMTDACSAGQWTASALSPAVYNTLHQLVVSHYE